MNISEMVSAFAGDYMSLGEDVEEMQSYLNAACVAWNIALLPPGERETALRQFLIRYERSNPGIDDMENVRADMKQLIKEKKQMFPNVKVAIQEARIEERNGKYRLVVASRQY